MKNTKKIYELFLLFIEKNTVQSKYEHAHNR